MLGKYYYHEVIRKTIIAFGTVFNNVHIKHNDADGTESDLKVAIAYGPVQKFLARLEQQPKLNKTVGLTLPRMSFEMTGISYDASRKTAITQTFKAVDSTDSKMKKVYMPVPYTLTFELNILAKLNDDCLQIIEQILPYFQPSFNVTIDLVSAIAEKKDVPIVLENISFTDDYEGNYETRRALIYTLTFSAKSYLFGPIADSSDGLIRKVQVDQYAGSDTTTAKREVRYTVEPDPVDAAPDDDFGFSESVSFFTDSRNYSPGTQDDR